jgi:alginate O-acetyltransferase complex protein AlgI
VFSTVALLGGRDWNTFKISASGWLHRAFSPTTRTIAPLIAMLVVVHPAVQGRTPPVVASSLQALKTTGLNARDDNMQDRGYYEQLEVRGPVQDQVLDVIDWRTGANWRTFSTTGVLRERRNNLVTQDLQPSRAVVWNGQSFSTNRWGMRDMDYTLETPADTFRIALLGPSFVMGSGVSDGETFETLVEDRLNRDFKLGTFQRFQILNFAVQGYTVPEQVALIEERVINFSPHLVVVTNYYPARAWTERYLMKVACSDFDIPHDSLRRLLADVGVGLQRDRGDIAVPFGLGRSLAVRMGLQPRMPSSECAVRVRTVANRVFEWSIFRFAEITRSHGMTPLVLGLNAVIDHAPPKMPRSSAIEATRLPVIDLFDVYPKDALASLRVASWDHHPNRVGHQLIAARLYQELVSFLETNAGRSEGARAGGLEQ